MREFCVGLGLAILAAVGGCMPPVPAPVNRNDLAAAYVEFEQAFFAEDAGPRDVADLNRAFDRASAAFFAGDNGAAIRTLRTETAGLRSVDPSSAGQRLAALLKASFDPPVLIRGGDATCRLTSVLPATVLDGFAAALTLRLRGADGAVALEQRVTLNPRALVFVDETFDLPGASSLAAGSYRVEIAPANGVAFTLRRWQVAERSLDAQYEEVSRLLDQVPINEAARRNALIVCRARTQWLTDEPADDDSSRDDQDLNALASDVRREAQALLDGRLPYRRKTGDYWRVIEVDGAVVPMRFYAPAAAAGDEPLPLIIAFHGAGGDENMFFEGYGAGLLKRLAEEHNCLAAAPLTYVALGNNAFLERVLAGLSFDYAIDRARVYLIGHSLGAVAAGGIARNNPERVAGVVGFSGSLSYSGAAAVPPSLIISGSLDVLSAVAAVRSSAESAAEAGLPVEFRQIDKYGHTLVVGAELRSAVEWLREQNLSRP